mmetsp:Transcript_154190/g.283888  ORF Transcript_154190/g.283888 Transcript_154190/m.283888 type:complete len:242 (+) Transcript_154190:2-727(+)
MADAAATVGMLSRPLGGRRLISMLLLMSSAIPTVFAAAKSSSEAESLSSFVWPDATMAQRTSDRVAAGKRAARHIACDVCEERVMSHFPASFDPEQVREVFESGRLAEGLGDVKALCAMKQLAETYRKQYREVVIETSGLARLKKQADGKYVFYEEINTSDLVFHWKSFAVKEACTEAFRRDADAVSRAVEKAFKRGGNIDALSSAELAERLAAAAGTGCRQSKTCKAADKLARAVAKAEL